MLGALYPGIFVRMKDLADPSQLPETKLLTDRARTNLLELTFGSGPGTSASRASLLLVDLSRLRRTRRGGSSTFLPPRWAPSWQGRAAARMPGARPSPRRTASWASSEISGWSCLRPRPALHRHVEAGAADGIVARRGSLRRPRDDEHPHLHRRLAGVPGVCPAPGIPPWLCHEPDAGGTRTPYRATDGPGYLAEASSHGSRRARVCRSRRSSCRRHSHKLRSGTGVPRTRA